VRTEGRVLGRDGCRVPLPWTGDPTTSFGFSATATASSTPHEPWLPQPDGWGAYAVDAQQGDASSMLSLYRHVLRRRRMLDPTTPLQWAIEVDDRLVAFHRGDVLVVLNLASDPVDLPAALVAGAHVALSSVVGHDDPTVVPGDACVWIAGSTGMG
jgi:alpha-glucosidase